MQLEIRDDGRGPQGEVERLPGNGLRSMQRRITVLGRMIRFDGSYGMSIDAYIPLGGDR